MSDKVFVKAYLEDFSALVKPNDQIVEKISKIKVDQLSQFYQKVFKSRYKLFTNNWKW